MGILNMWMFPNKTPPLILVSDLSFIFLNFLQYYDQLSLFKLPRHLKHLLSVNGQKYLI